MIPESEIQKLIDLPIESVAERLGLEVRKHKALCPFHDDTHPSLSFKVSWNKFRCFVCGAHGNTIDLAMKVLNKNFKETCEWLGGENVCVSYSNISHSTLNTQHSSFSPDIEYLSSLIKHPVLNEPARKFLFEERKLNPRVIEWCGISSISSPTPCWRYGKPFYDAPSLLFPYKDINGNVLNVQSRYLGNSEERKPRFRFPSNSSIHIFNMPILRYLKPDEPLYISEGITDCLALLSSGHKAIAIPSATLLKPEDLKSLETWTLKLGTTFHMYPDQDEPGEQLYQQLVRFSLTLGVVLIRKALPPDCKDYSDYYLKYLKIKHLQ